jgi:hypothetical protein
MKTPYHVIATLLAAFCVGYSSPSLSFFQAPGAYQRQAPGAYNVLNPTPRGTPCGENGLYSNGMGTCCSRIQTNPSSCQPPPLAQRQH